MIKNSWKNVEKGQNVTWSTKKFAQIITHFSKTMIKMSRKIKKIDKKKWKNYEKLLKKIFWNRVKRGKKWGQKCRKWTRKKKVNETIGINWLKTEKCQNHQKSQKNGSWANL